LGGQTIELKPLTLEEFLELIYLGSDVLHTALMAWAATGETSSFIMSLVAALDKEVATKLVCMFLHVEPEWLEENASADEVFDALGKAIRLNDWSGVLQVMVVLDTLKMDEVIEQWQMAKVSLKKS
jgi:hypothetical protein